MSGPYSDEEWRKFNDELKKAVLRGYPNPNRIGCPGADVLKQLASRQLETQHPAYGHVMECSPCYQELLDIRASMPTPFPVAVKPPSTPRWIWQTTVFAGLLICGILIYIAFSRRAVSEGSKQEIALNVDLQNWRVFRSDVPGKEKEPLILPRQRLDLTFSLPVGSEDGEYDVRITSNRAGPSLISGRGTARLENYSATLRTRLDISSLPLGNYILELRRIGAGALYVPIRVSDQGIR